METVEAAVPAVSVPVSVPQQRIAEPEPQPAADQPSPAFLVLARLGRADARLALSAADCAARGELAAEWFARGVDADYLTRALIAALPESVGSPFGLVRRRLRDKLPPRLPGTAAVASGTPVCRLMIECTECGVPGRPEAFRDELCAPCRRPDPEPAA
ncbi:hypothetical protein GCM10015535_44280 [Streptomyces gelaticus]|uniref:Uncharacterized protein n=1 Tax=Streptomyces gelaticus TaxID=285446 RepID=A0ABQ2W516_9ACTN|nr:hypothetical protein [Streptomyces gelaticus]GGV89751.1 hypothetical protein GCM10015535_44280 [Streptomyces gelaticus]